MAQKQIVYELLTPWVVENFSRTSLDEINAVLSSLGPEVAQVNRAYLTELARHSVVILAKDSAISPPIIVGIACLARVWGLTSQVGCITHIAVTPPYQRSGIGTSLVQGLIRKAQFLSLTRIDLTSQPRREAAQQFWPKLGFVQRETNNFRLELS